MHIDPSGGQGIGPDATGRNYPLLEPGPDMAGVLADFYLAHRVVDAVLPLSIAWLYGANLAYNDGAPDPADSGSGVAHTPPHAADVVVVDAANVPVFDSTAATSFRSTAFSNRLHVYEWADASTVCRLVQHTAVPDPSLFSPRPARIWPVDGRLDERCSELIPSRLTGLQGLSGGVAVAGGYNTTLDASPGPPGLRRSTTLTLAMAAGSGLGRAPGCVDLAIHAATINGATADARGNLTLAADGCYWARPPVSGDALVPGVLQVGNDCGPCCSDADYVRVAASVVAAFGRLEAVGTGAAKAACGFAQLVARWDGQKSCREAATVKMNAVAFGLYVEVVAQCCNASGACLDDVVLSVAYSSTVAVAVFPGTSVVTDGLGNTSAGDPGSTPGVAAFTFASVAPGVAVTARFRIVATVAALATADVTMVASATAGGVALPGTVTRTVTVEG